MHSTAYGVTALDDPLIAKQPNSAFHFFERTHQHSLSGVPRTSLPEHGCPVCQALRQCPVMPRLLLDAGQRCVQLDGRKHLQQKRIAV
jgi:hypothetical protein